MDIIQDVVIGAWWLILSQKAYIFSLSNDVNFNKNEEVKEELRIDGSNYYKNTLNFYRTIVS